jgi:hypothetical protein
MRIKKIEPLSDFILRIESEDGQIGEFDVKPYLAYEAFVLLKDIDHFKRVRNGGYYIEWDCGADLSADTIEAKWENVVKTKSTCVAEDITPYGKD